MGVPLACVKTQMSGGRPYGLDRSASVPPATNACGRGQAALRFGVPLQSCLTHARERLLQVVDLEECMGRPIASNTNS
jgi:hypothetical protein